MNTHITAPVAVKPRLRFAYLILTEDGRCIASNHYGEFALNRLNRWDWIVGYMIQEFGCDPDDVDCLETDDGDRITVDGKIVAELVEE